MAAKKKEKTTTLQKQAIPRTISNKFIYDLGNPEGILYPIFEYARDDEELSIQIRDGYVNVYYLGGSMLCIWASGDKYIATQDSNYLKGTKVSAKEEIKTSVDASSVAWSFKQRKDAMKKKLETKNTDEKIFQQKLYNANRKGGLVVVDTEVQIPGDVCEFLYKLEPKVRHPRFDMVGLSKMENGKYRPVLIENKWGTKALYGKDGVEDHARDMLRFVRSRFWAYYMDELEEQAAQLQRLGLIELDRFFCIDREEYPEMMFVLGDSKMELKELEAMRDKMVATIKKEKKKPSWIGYNLTISALTKSATKDDYAIGMNSRTRKPWLTAAISVGQS
ncbi:MAG: hypothetical protein LBT45_03540 [Rickettsiales bacterium]|jgi:hypothetical protein|nr:hypothetical protein [Rickettsiales bacterium]